MTTATMSKPTSWESVFPEFKGTVLDRIQEWAGDDPDRLAALYRAARHEADDCEHKGDAFVYASTIKGQEGPAAVIAEFLRVYSEGYVETIIHMAEREMEGPTDAPDEAPARATGHHAQDDAADDGKADETDEADDDDDAAIGRGVYDSAIPKARAIVAALQVVDGLPLWDEPNPGTPWCDGQGIAYAEFAVGLMLNHSIDQVVEKLPLAEQAKMLKLVTEQAKPYTGNGFKVKHDKRPVDTVAAAELLTRCGADVESLIEAIANREIWYKVTEAIGAAIEAMLNAMPLEARARVYKLVHARATQHHRAVEMKAERAGCA